ncbi:oxygen-independent coproporphyrinogen III oxidase [Arenicella xantha]|uniref:Coproporphyrinogen-III oxidase n=1 Tax=Arenicella xantha TaxID=644221 RepID=A0A395JIU9_9GAMM|nr:oxygen-independent coproporphyrinogen III oxidase [Arenicella xantha]RBP50703.1 oxygen-independent coproporphyrinogen-3 oxidase [Arenicella xantha]
MFQATCIPAGLIERYDTMAPRYTSYPSAPQFSDQFDESHLAIHAERSNASLLPKDLSVYVHIPFCHSLCYFCGCNKVVTRTDNQKVSEYLDNLMHEIALRARLYSDDRLVTQIHFGGGTPNFLSLDQIASLLDQIALQFHLDLPNNLEIGIELDPRFITSDELRTYQSIGFNRFSIGVQDFSKPVQTAINRVQDEAKTLEIINTAMECANSVNVDLITGLPFQQLTTFADTLDKIIRTKVSRIATYNFAYMPTRIKAQKMISASTLPSSAVRMELVSLVREKLHDAGYQHIGMDHYALPSDSLSIAQDNGTLQRNFQGYTTHRDTDLIGVGASAISKFDTAFSQNETTLSLYNEALARHRLPIAKGVELDDDDRIRSAVIQQIMCRNKLDLTLPIGQFIERDTNTTLADYLSSDIQRLTQFIQDGLLVPVENGFEVTDTGRFFMRSIASVFDKYLTKQSSDRVVPFSRTV